LAWNSDKFLKASRLRTLANSLARLTGLVTLYQGRFRLSGLSSIVILLIVASSFLYAPSLSNDTSSNPAGPRLPVQVSPSQNITKVSINPAVITAVPVGSQMTFGVNISKTAAFNGIWVTVEYDNTILNALSVDYSGGIMGPNPLVVYDCVNGQPASSCPGQSQTDYGANKVSVQLLLLGSFINNASGPLFNVKFQVIGTGLSNIHITRGQIVLVSTLLPSVASDGYFSNKICGSVLCRPLVVSLNYTRVPVPVVGRVVKFNASVVNPNGDTVQWYHWEWGDSPTVGATDLFTRVSYTNHTYLAPSNPYGVTLIVNDTYGIMGVATIALVVGRVWVQLGIGSLAAKPSSQVVPGTKVNVTVQMQNLSTTNQSAQVSVLMNRGILGNQTLLTKTCSLLRPSGSCSSSAVLDTSNLTPRVYLLTANGQLTITNSTLFQNDTSASSQAIFLWLVTALPSNAGLSISQGSLIGIGGIIVVYAAFLLVRRLTRRNTEL
jgi:hypothetical protein